MIDRPTFNYDNSGQPAEPAAPVSHTELIEQIKSEPSGAPQTSTEVATTEQQKSPAHSTSVRDDKGKIVRPDWSERKEVVRNPKDWDFDGSGKERQRDEAGRYVSKNKAEYLAQWAKEGGIAANMAAVNRVESMILNASSDAAALQAHVATLDEDIRLLAADHMRLTTAHGPNGGSIKLDGFLNALSPSQFEKFHQWWRGLSRADQDNILGATSL